MMGWRRGQHDAVGLGAGDRRNIGLGARDAVGVSQLAGTRQVAIDERDDLDPVVPRQDGQQARLRHGAAADDRNAEWVGT